MSDDSIAGTLREHGYKLTPQRRAVLEVITASHDHLTPAAIYERVQKEYPTIGLVTIYRVLEMLTGLDLICRVHTEDGCRSYLTRPPAHHHHLMCTSCHRVVDFTKCDLGELQQRLSKETGFKIQDHLLQFNGVCRDCQERNRAGISTTGVNQDERL